MKDVRWLWYSKSEVVLTDHEAKKCTNNEVQCEKDHDSLVKLYWLIVSQVLV